jgi:hypothetical protein
MSNGLQWGSVSEMVGGVGSALAVLVALFIAFIEWRRGRRAETATERGRQAKQNALINEAERLASELKAQCQKICLREKLASGSVSERVVREFIDEMDSLENQVDDLLKYPNDDPRLYVEIGRLKTLCKVEAGFDRRNTRYVTSIAESLITKIESRQAAITALRDQP